MKKGAKISIWIAPTILVIFLAIDIAASLFLIDYSLSPNMLSNSRIFEKSIAKIKADNPQTTEWIDSIFNGQFKDTTIIDDRGYKLFARYAPAKTPTEKTAMIVHGYHSSSLEMLHIAYMYHHDLGYNIFLPDLFAHGESEGDHVRMGWFDRLDVMSWMNIANEVFGGDTKMVVHGISMGAATTMMISGEENKPFVKAFVEDCGYTSVWDEFAGELKAQFNLPKFPLLYSASIINGFANGWDFKEASALKQVAKCSLPMLFIHGDADDFVPTWMVYPLYEAKPEPKELWLTPGVDHARSYQRYPTEYTQRVSSFLESHI